MMLERRYTVTEACKLLGLCRARVTLKVREGHFPGATKCECGCSYMIPESDIQLNLKKLKDRRRKDEESS